MYDIEKYLGYCFDDVFNKKNILIIFFILKLKYGKCFEYD